MHIIRRCAPVATLLSCASFMAAMLASPSADALPSFARQTGAACAQCHAIAFGPALTEFGRQFKLNGYTWGSGGAVPLSGMVVGSFDRTRADQPEAPAAHLSTNDNLVLDELSAFYGGRLTEHSGAFAQVTYSGIDRHTSWDNLDVRYARPFAIGGLSGVAGVSLNNNPTIQDLWNSTPAWGFPYVGSEIAPGPAAVPLISDGLGQNVLGTSAYAMVNGVLYLEAGAYRGLTDRWLHNLGGDPDESPHVSGMAPHWRMTLQHQIGPHYFSGGLFGLSAKLRPDPASAATDRYTDFGLDGTYQYNAGSDHTVNANLSYIHERRRLDASAALDETVGTRDQLEQVRFDVGYAWKQTWVASVGLFDVTGSRDRGLFAPGALDGSASGKPDTRGYTVQLEYVPFGKAGSLAAPWLNMRVGAQYTGYDRFNGGTGNYDGFGRSAKQNDTLFLYAWFAF